MWVGRSNLYTFCDKPEHDRQLAKSAEPRKRGNDVSVRWQKEEHTAITWTKHATASKTPRI